MRKTSTIVKDPPKRIFNCTDVLIIGTARNHIHPFDACSVPKELFCIERGCNSRTEICERETKCETTCMQAAFSTRTNLFSLLPALPLPPSHPPPINVIREASCVYFLPPPTHAPPIAELGQFSATSAKSEDGLKLGA